MNLGPHQFRRPFFLAPLAGVSDRPFRTICRQMGAVLTYTEMVSAHGLLHGNRQTASYLDREPDEIPFAVQIFAAEPEVLARGAVIVVNQGADIVDLNMACPVRKVCGSGAGAALARSPHAVEQAVRAVVAAVNVPVTVKIRSGWDENQVNCVEVARAAETGGAAAIAVHGRTRAQMYSGKADWGQIRAVKEAVQVPVLGSGDIWSAADALRMRAETGCDAVLVARGACGNPWIFRQLAAATEGQPIPSPPVHDEWAAVVLRHAQLQTEHCFRQRPDRTNSEEVERMAIRGLRKHLLWYARGRSGVARFRRALTTLETVSELRTLLDSLRTNKSGGMS